jgi:Protein of unknown function (DUF1552)
MMIFKKAIPRRTFLRGAGATLALPLLDGMIPAFASSAEVATKAPVRLGIVYVPNGMWPMDQWTPRTEGADFKLSPTLEPLARFRDRILVLTGLSQNPAKGRSDHSFAFATFLTCVHPKGDQVGISFDQIAAEQIGKTNQLSSLEVALFPSDLVGKCEGGLSCDLISTLCWRNATTPLPMEKRPRAVFERLFGDSESTDSTERLKQIRQKRSILDSMVAEVASLAKELGADDRTKIDQYLQAVRDVERRIEIAEEQSNRETPQFAKPMGIPSSFEQYSKLMMDLQVLAYQTDLTRITTISLGREGPVGTRTYPDIGIAEGHHTLSHHQGNPATIAKLAQINAFNTKIFAYYLEKLQSVSDGDGTLLDHIVLLYGSGLSDGNSHSHDDLPLLLAGGAGGQLKGGRHIVYKSGTAMANLHLTIMEKLGMPMEKFGDSDGKLNLLSV